jgi:hypothetical protein
MKTVGVTSSGGVLIEANVSELRVLAEVGKALADVYTGGDGVVRMAPPVRTLGDGTALMDVDAQIPKKRITTPPAKQFTANVQRTQSAKSEKKADPNRARKDRADVKRNKVCLICKKTFHDDSRTNSRKCCSDACTKQHVWKRDHPD